MADNFSIKAGGANPPASSSVLAHGMAQSSPPNPQRRIPKNQKIEIINKGGQKC